MKKSAELFQRQEAMPPFWGGERTPNPWQVRVGDAETAPRQAPEKKR